MSTHYEASRLSTSRAKRPAVAIAALLCAVGLLAACSSSKSATGSSSTPAGSSGTSASSATSAPGGSSGATSGIAAAEATVAKYTPQPTTIGITTKVGQPIPKGKTLDFISCGVSAECTQEAGIIKSATDLLGWTFKVINTDGTPQTQKSAFDQVVREKPDAVLYSAIDKSTFASELPTIKANGTFVAACCITDAVGDGIDYAIDVPAQTGPIGDLQAAIVAADSKGKGGDSVYVNLPSFPILTYAEGTYTAGMKNYCPTCTVGKLDIAITSLGKDEATQVVSYLRSHTNVKYVVVGTDGLAIGLPAAIKAAGMTDIKIVGQGATATNLQYLATGDQFASVAFPYYEVLWSMVDAAARHEAGVPVLPSVAPPLWLLTKSNAPQTTSIFKVVPDIETEYKTLWGLS